MKKLFKLFVSVIMMAITLACYSSCNQNQDDLLENKTPNHPHRVLQKRIPKEITNLSKSDAAIVAELFQSKDKTRAEYSDAISIVPIRDKNGEVKIYAVNFFDGYVLVSATKKYFPILAYIDHGTYTHKNKINGEEFLINGMIDRINKIDLDTVQKKKEHIAHEWSKFEELEMPVFTRAGINDFDDAAYEEALSGLEEMWWDPCSGQLYKLTECQNLFTPEEYASYCTRAEAEFDDLFGGSKYEWENTAMVGIYEEGSYESTGVLLKTRWDQDWDDSIYSKKMGCTTIAVGQIMKFFEYPLYFNWSEMHNTQVTSTATNFLYQLRANLNTTEDGASSIQDAYNVLTQYGYQCSIKNHNSALVQGSLRKKRPVFQSGVEHGKANGHAWVCDGYSFSQDYVEYKLFGLGYSPYRPNEICYVEIEGNNKIIWYDYGTPYYHMNWGNGGLRDGWYMDDLSDSMNQFVNYRADIIIDGMR